MNHPSTHAPPFGGAPGLPPPENRKHAVEAVYATGHWLMSQERFNDAATVFRAMALVAPEDERSWLALGTCHEALEQPLLALEMYGVGRVLAQPSSRCEIARARLLRRLGRDEEAEAALTAAEAWAEERGDEELDALVREERRRT